MDLSRTEPALELLEHLCACVNVPFDLAAGRRLLALKEREEEQQDWCSTVRHAGIELGVAWRSFDARASEAIAGVGPRHPILLWRDPSRPDGWILLVERRHRMVKAITSTEPSGRWLRPEELDIEAGSEEPIRLWAADPATPLSWLSGRGGKTTPIARLMGLLNAEREDLKVIGVFALGIGVLSLVTPIAVQSLVNNVAFGTLIQPVVVLTFAVILGLGLSSALRALEVYVVEILQRRLFIRVTGDLAHRLPRVQAGAYDGANGPELVNRYFDVFTVHKATATLLLDGLDLVLRTGVGLLLLAFYHPLMLAFDVVLVLSLLFVLLVLGRTGEKTAVKESKAKYAVASWLETIAARPNAFKSPSAQIMARDRVDHLARDFLVSREQHFRVVMRQTIGSLVIQTFASAALLGLGGWLVIEGQLTLGQLVAAELVVTSVVASFSKMGKQLESYYDLLAGVDKLGQLADLPMEHHAGETGKLAPNEGGSQLDLNGVTIQRPNRPAILRAVDHRFECGSATAIYAPSGSGKTSLAAVLNGLRRPANGWLKLNGTDYRDLSVDDLRRRMAIAGSHDLIPGTIAQNVRMGRVYLENTE
ncbi:MAG: ABC transporter ATP-binding protein, partial [Myxococcota bacterium]